MSRTSVPIPPATARGRWGPRRTFGALIGLGLVWSVALSHGARSPLRVEPLRRASGASVVDEHLELARRYAPWNYHAVDPDRGRQDLPAPVDLDGNHDGEDNWESFASVELVSTLPYQLESTAAKLWPLLASVELVGEGRLLDGPWPYRDARVSVGVPRFHEADRFSGPFGPDRGISPFAVDFGWEPGTLGALFFDPARRWADLFGVPEPWALELVGDPFVTR